MLPEDRVRFPPVPQTLKDGRSIAVRMATTEDGPAIGRFYAAIPRSDWRFYCPWPLDAKHAQEKIAARADDAHFVCALGINAAGDVVGYAWYSWKEASSHPSTFGICVRPDYQNNGTGRAIMERLLEVACHVGPPTMSLTVQKANPRAVALYRKMGFRVVREQMRGQVAEFAPEPEYYMERLTRKGPDHADRH